MIIVDSNHLRVLRNLGSAGDRLKAKIVVDGRQPCTTVINVHESINGYFSLINRAKTVHQKVLPYRGLSDTLDYFANWTILPFDDFAAAEFDRLRLHRELKRIGTMDLQLAAIAIYNGATLLTSDGDFDAIAHHSHLDVQDWL